MSLNYQIGETLRVDGDLYHVIGKIAYKALSDGSRWIEYKLREVNTREIGWLSIDESNQEFSISWMVSAPSLEGYHLVDEGEMEVLEAKGDVDVFPGERAHFTEYEDETEEKIISEERWEDEIEYARGYYLDQDEIARVDQTLDALQNTDSKVQRNSVRSTGAVQRKKRKSWKLGLGIIVAVIAMIFIVNLGMRFMGIGSKEIMTYLRKNPDKYTYVTSITGEQDQKADVYRADSGMDLDRTAKDIIDGIDGQTEYVQQNTEDSDQSIAILTEKEYCLIYISEDAEVLVQISNRKYPYTSDKRPYRAYGHTHRYYRNYYYTRGYYNDRERYGKNSSYMNGDYEMVDGNVADPYSDYATSIRQSSTGSRTSSGGGISSGK